MAEEQQKHDFGRRGTSHSLPQKEMVPNTDRTMIPNDEPGKLLDARGKQFKEVFFSPWAICH